MEYGTGVLNSVRTIVSTFDWG